VINVKKVKNITSDSAGNVKSRLFSYAKKSLSEANLHFGSNVFKIIKFFCENICIAETIIKINKESINQESFCCKS